MSKSELAKIFKEFAILLELKGENPFRTKSYTQASRTLDKSSYSLKELIEDNQLKTLPGFGPALTEKINEYYQSKTISSYEKLKQEVDLGLQDFVKLSGIGPKKARFLFYDLGAKSLGELEYACLENRLVKLKGFGEKTQHKILEAIQFKKSHSGQRLLSEALHEASQLQNKISSINGIENIELVGDLRRYLETISKICFLVDSNLSPENLVTQIDFLKDIKINNSYSIQGISDFGLPVEIYFSSQQLWGYHSILLTGNHNHLNQLNQYSDSKIIFSKENFSNPKFNFDLSDEEKIYDQLNLQFIPPELREGFDEIKLSQKNQIPNLIELSDLKGCFHAHSTYSDGKNSIEEMSQACQDINLSYLGMSDHSQTAVYANGLKNEDIDIQHQEIDKLNHNSEFQIFKGIESDILKDGSLDYEDHVLEKFDFVIASVHQRFKADKGEMTDRLVKVLKNPHTTMLGHLSGRLLLSRPEYEFDVSEIIKMASQYNRIIEINANPHRLDMDWRHLSQAKKLGVKISINPDAHSTSGFDDLKYGVMMARKGGLTKDDVLNTLCLGEMKSFLDSL